MPTIEGFQSELERYSSAMDNAKSGVFRDEKISCSEARKGTEWYGKRKTELTKLRQKLKDAMVNIRTEYANKIMLTTAEDNTKASLVLEKDAVLNDFQQVEWQIDTLIAEGDWMLQEFAETLVDCD